MDVRGHDDNGEMRADGWFAQQLGAGWESSGDGIYRYVGEPLEMIGDEQDLVDSTGPARQAVGEQEAHRSPRTWRWLRH